MDTLSPAPEGSDGWEAEVTALLRLLAIEGVGPARLREAVGAAGSAHRLVAWPDARRAAALRCRSAPGTLAAARQVLADCRRTGVRVVAWHESAYPGRLRHLTDPPPLLFVRGDVTAFATRQVAVVGSRRATAYGRRAAHAIAGGLARAGVSVLSGMAMGIDGAAHVAALEAGGVSTAVLGSGPERAQPRSHARLYRRLCRQGAVASEHPPGTPALPHHFPKRNRLLAALSEAVVVVEAAERSGALITAREAVELGRDVLAVPGPVDSPTSRGTNALLRDGAALALDAASVLAALGLSGLAEQGSFRPAPPERLGTDAAAVWQELEAIPRSVDDLARVAGLDAATALSALTRLEVAGWARQSPGMRFQRRDA